MCKMGDDLLFTRFSLHQRSGYISLYKSRMWRKDEQKRETKNNNEKWLWKAMLSWCWERVMHIKRRRMEKISTSAFLFVVTTFHPNQRQDYLRKFDWTQRRCSHHHNYCRIIRKDLRDIPILLFALRRQVFFTQIPLGDPQRSVCLASKTKRNVIIIVDNRHAK